MESDSDSDSDIVTSGAGLHGWLAQTHRIAIRRRLCVCGCVCVCVWVGVHAFARERVHACACVRASVRACVRDVFVQYTILIFDPS